MRFHPSHIILSFFLILSGILNSHAQNCNPIDTFLLIPDNQATTLQITIDNILNNDLSNPGQCLLGVQLEFEHEHIGDLTIGLTSPNGDEIQLIGPHVVNFPTPFAHWNVFFTACGSPTAPDPPGFPGIWDNQAPWAAFGDYSGIYHPYQGCMESFDSGPVNGTWTLNIKDNIEYDSGILLGINFFFCDPTGMDCSLCTAEGGSFVTPDMSYCAGDPQLNLEAPQIIFDSIPDPDKYAYDFFSVFNDTIYQEVNAIDLSNAAPGNYQICGISYNKNDSIFLDSIMPGIPFSNIQELIDAENSNFCAGLTDTCLLVEILPVGEVTDTTLYLCPGDSIWLDTLVFTQNGDYFLVDDSDEICGKITRLHIEDYGLDASIDADSYELNCNQNTIELHAITNSIQGDVDFFWSTENGNFMSETDQTDVQISRPGIYYFILEKNNCFDTTSVTIFSDGALPDFAISGGTIDCNNPFIQINLTPFGPYGNVDWIAPDNNILNTEDPLVSLPGDYILELTGINGCISIGSVEIGIDTIFPNATLSTDTLDCFETSVTIDFNTSDLVTDIFWPQLGQFIEDPTITVADVYEVQYSGPNGCISIDSIEVYGDYHFPEISVTNDTITCIQNEVFLDLSYQDDTLNFIWTNPDSEVFLTEDITTYLSGWHQLSVVNGYNCSLDTLIFVEEDLSIPQFFMPDSIVLACDADSVKLAVFFIDAFSKVNWSGPGGFSNNTPEPFVKKLGQYIIEVTGTNGCTHLDSIIIVNPPEVPEVTVLIDTINCLNSTGKILLDFSGDLSFEWLDELGNSYSGPEISSDLGGYYNLTITDNDYNCTSETVLDLPVDTIPPPITIAAPDTLNCINPMVELLLESTSIIQSVHWTGNGIDEFTNPAIVNNIGWYFVEAIGENYCINMDSVQILEQNGFLTAPAIYYLDCAFDSIQIFSDEIQDATYNWSLNGIYISDQTSIYVTEEGDYQLKVNTISGCIDSVIVQVMDDRILPEFELAGIGELNCADSSMLISATLISDIIDFEWTGSAYSSQLLTDTVFQEGSYYFTAEGANHCYFTDSIIITPHRDLPEFEAIGDSINCFDNSDQLFITADIQSDYGTLFWLGPNFFVSGDITNAVQDTGIYILTVEGDKGCFLSDTTHVLLDTLPVLFTIDPLDTINCFRDSVLLSLSSSYYFDNIHWEGPDDFDEIGNAVYASTAGLYWVSVQGENGCVNKRLFELPQNKLIPYMQISGIGISCNQPKVPLQLVTNIQNVFVQWTGPNNFVYTGQNPVVLNAGTYHAVLTDLKNGCQNEDSITIENNLAPPVIETEVFHLGCDGDQIQIHIESNPDEVDLVWNGPDNFYSEQDRPYVSTSGIYYIQATRKDNGCSTSDSLEVSEDPQLPSLDFQFQDFDCINDSLAIYLTNQFMVDSLFWSGPDNFIATGENPVIYSPGTYFLSVKGTNGCVLDTSLIVLKDTIPPFADIVYDDFLLCEKNTARLNATASSTGANFIYDWNSPDGAIINGIHSLNPLVEGPGTYYLKVTDLKNNCETLDSIFVEQKESEMDSLLVLTERPSCFGFEDGKITVNAVLTGYPPYAYSLNGANYSISNIFTNKAAGNYTISVSDTYGCKTDTTIILDHGPDIQLVLTASEQEIHIGESSLLQALVSSENEISWIEWEPLYLIENPQSFTNKVSPLESTVFKIYIEDNYGCSAEDYIYILVIEAPEIYIPNIFTPNADDKNDRFYVLGKNGVDKIRTFEVFDRWGNRVFAEYDIQPGDYSKGWDGNYRGQAMNPGVYVYHLTVLSKNGKLIHMGGDITLIR